MSKQEISKQTSTGLSLKDRLKQKNSQATLLLDVSGSMNSSCEPGQTKIQALERVVQGIKGNPQVFCFADDCRPCLKDAIPRPAGGTYMSRAFEMLHKHHVRKAVLITDGDNAYHDKELALEAAKGLELQILYIGPGEKPEFLDKLASQSGTLCTAEDIKLTKELTAKIQLLIGSGEKRDETICL